jgi:hypothetical protein
MILNCILESIWDQGKEIPRLNLACYWTYHRFVKTTPKPRATKKRRGELVGLVLFSGGGLVVAAGGPAEVVVGVDMIAHPTKELRILVAMDG